MRSKIYEKEALQTYYRAEFVDYNGKKKKCIFTTSEVNSAIERAGRKPTAFGTREWWEFWKI